MESLRERRTSSRFRKWRSTSGSRREWLCLQWGSRSSPASSAGCFQPSVPRDCRSPERCGKSEEISMAEGCAHVEAVTEVKHPKKRECEECIKTGSRWLHL